jgi:hypothetical protein
MTTTKTKSRLQAMYMEQVAPKLMKEFGLKNISQVPTIEKVVVNAGVGKQLENQKLKPEYVPGDIGFDPLGLKPTDPEEFRIMQTKELQNGRLAMLAAAGFLAQEFATGSTWGTYFGRPDL